MGKLYYLCFLILLTLFYIVPYLILPDARGLELLSFWISATLVAGIMSAIKLYRREEGDLN